MKYKLKVYTIWEYGQRKDAEGNPHQEDCTFPLPNSIKDTDRTFILCDGMGGHDAGEVASATVCEAMGQSIQNSQLNAEGNFTDEMFRKALTDAFDALDEKDTGAAKKMGTTMTFLKLHKNGCTIAHMGDSRVYHIRPGKTAADTRILFQTKDHSLVNDLIAIGELTEEEAKHSRQKNVITRAMQPHMEHRPKADMYHSTDIRPGDYFYLCSDGMLENMESPQICYNFSDAAGTDEEKVKRLTQATSENRDNHTAIIVHILEVTDPVEERKPAPAQAPSAPTPIMAEVHDETEEEEERGGKDGKPVQIPQTTNRKGSLSRYLLIALVTLIVAFAIALYFLVFAKGADKDKAGKKEPARTEQKVDDKQRENVPPANPQPPKKQQVEQTPPAETSLNQQTVNANEAVVQEAINKAEPSDPDNEEEEIVESDEDKIENMTDKKANE